jgi:putative transposase
VLTAAAVRVSMDGRGRWMDNVFIERLWRSLKYECIYLNAFETGSEVRAGLARWIDYYNTTRPLVSDRSPRISPQMSPMRLAPDRDHV